LAGEKTAVLDNEYRRKLCASAVLLLEKRDD